MDTLGLIDHKNQEMQQEGIILAWIENNHPAYNDILSNPEAMDYEYKKIDLYFLYHNIDVSQQAIQQHSEDIQQWLLTSEADFYDMTNHLFEAKTQGINYKDCKSCNKDPANKSNCSCKNKEWLLWLALATILLIILNLKRYVAAAIYTVAVIFFYKPKLLKNGL